jgi:hypothetical protein
MDLFLLLTFLPGVPAAPEDVAPPEAGVGTAPPPVPQVPGEPRRLSSRASPQPSAARGRAPG